MLLLLLASLAVAPEVTVEPTAPRLGDPAIVWVSGMPHDAQAGTAEAFGYAFALQPAGDARLRAVVAVPTDVEPGPHPVRIRHPKLDKGGLEATLTIAGREFEKSELTVAKRYTKKKRSKKLQARLTRERKAIAAVWRAAPTAGRSLGRPAWPTKTKLTGTFGTIRVFNKTRRSVHYGIDLKGGIGEPVYASESGKVVLSSMRWGSGGTLVIDHGGGLFTSYFHLAKRRVKLGAVVKRGQRIGDVGRSGRVTGPHLHFGVAIRAEYVDGKRKGQARPMYVDPEGFLALDFAGRP